MHGTAHQAQTNSSTMRMGHPRKRTNDMKVKPSHGGLNLLSKEYLRAFGNKNFLCMVFANCIHTTWVLPKASGT